MPLPRWTALPFSGILGPMTAIRPTSVAGTFYPADPATLRDQLDRFLGAAMAALPAGELPVPKALIAPHAGYVYSGPIAASAYARLLPARGSITRVVLMGPSHRVGFKGLAAGTAEQWASPLGAIAIDRASVGRLLEKRLAGVLDQAHAAEHSLEVHIPFLQAVLGEFQLVPIVAGDAAPEQVAACLSELWGGPETLIVISTDLSHFLDYATCRTTDAATVAAIEHLDYAALDRNSACGRVPVAGMLRLAQSRFLSIETLDVRNSGDTAGTKDRVVGYGAWALFEPDLVGLAWRSIRHGLETGTPLPAGGGAQGAVFVTLKKNGQLRGCIGSPMAWRPLLQDLAENAFKAAFADPRFPKVTAEELDTLTLSVSVLTPASPMSFTDEADMLAKLRPGIDGLIIEDQGRRALFLPSVWEQLPDKRQFLAHLKHKAGMPVDHWSDSFKASTFQAVEVK